MSKRNESENCSIIEWIVDNGIRNEKSDLIEFRDHPYQYDILRDVSPFLCVLKAAQIGMSTIEILKNHYDAKMRKMDIIYTLPTDADAKTFVDSKVNRIIANNPCMQKDTKDHDTVEKKKIGDSMVYFRGTWTDKAAIMITADRLVHDEKDSSKQSVVADYQARLQHSKYKQIHVFSHPSVPNNGVDIEWQLSDMKEWFITCPHCLKRQYLSWDTEDEKRMSVDLIQKCYVCKFCRKELSDSDRRKGKWIPRKGKEQAKYSGYHVSLLMSPIHSAQSIIDKWNEVVRGKQTADFFYNKVLGLPYTGSGNAVTKNVILGAVTKDKPDYNSRIVIGVDTGLKQHYVYGTRNGIYGYGQMDDFMPDEINKLPLDRTVEYFLKKFDNSIMVIDVGGEIIQSRKLRQKYPGRVFLCHYVRDRKTMQLIRWGEGDESGNVLVDRNRVIQLVIDEFKDKRIKLFRGDEDAYYDYWLHWSHIYRTVEEDKSTQMPRYVWIRNDADHLVHASVYWRVALDRFAGTGSVYSPQNETKANSYAIEPDETVDIDMNKFILAREESIEDWRN